MRWWKCVLAGSLGLILSTANSSADGFTAADVTAWELAQQDWYFQVSITMAGIIAAENEHPTAGCINDWYLADEKRRIEINADIRATMQKYSGYHPGTVLAAVIREECGTLNFSE